MASITWKPDSSNIAVIAYYDAQHYVEVTFTNGTKYRSKGDMPRSLMLEWIAADSAGGFYHTRIKGQFEMEKVQEETK